jgi:hypothetical protein
MLLAADNAVYRAIGDLLKSQQGPGSAFDRRDLGRGRN